MTTHANETHLTDGGFRCSTCDVAKLLAQSKKGEIAVTLKWLFFSIRLKLGSTSACPGEVVMFFEPLVLRRIDRTRLSRFDFLSSGFKILPDIPCRKSRGDREEEEQHKQSIAHRPATGLRDNGGIVESGRMAANGISTRALRLVK